MNNLLSFKICNMEVEAQKKEKVGEEKAAIVIEIPPIRNTASLDITKSSPNSEVKSHLADIARKQLDNLNKLDRKPKRKATPTTSDTESPIAQKAELVHDPQPMHTLTSAIVSKEELENEIRKKVAKQDPIKKAVGSIEIPQEMILSGLTTTPISKAESALQLHDQELIDILEGKSGDETEVFELVTEEGKMVLLKEGAEPSGETTSYEIVTGDSKVSEAKLKLLEREIAMRQIASLPMRKNKKSAPKSASSSQPTIAQSLAAEWDDDNNEEMILEYVNMEEEGGEPKIKILNMTILNDSPTKTTLPAVAKAEPKILNKDAPKSPPKILNINAPSAEAPATFKRTRVIKKKEIWDPSEAKAAASTVTDKKPAEKIPLSLPPSITIKKLTKESISKANASAEVAAASKPVVKKVGKKRSEVDKLLQDEGAVNMIYSLERENNNEDVPEIAVKPDQKSLIDKSQEKSSLMTKAKAIKNVVLKQSTSPPELKPPGRARAKRDVTPVKVEIADLPVVIAKKAPAAAGRKKKADNSWDYIYSQAQATCDDAMIIRRRSNSSYSSSAASPRRLSVDVNESFESPPASAKKVKRDNKEAFEFTKPPQKNTKSPADNVLNKDFVEELRGKISTELTKGKPPAATKGRKRAAPPAAENIAPPSKRASERRSNGSDHKEYRLVKTGNVAHIILNQNPLSTALLSEMKSLLNQLETDECQVVLITSSEGFSEGLDYSTLIQTTVDKRKQAASDLVTAFK